MGEENSTSVREKFPNPRTNFLRGFRVGDEVTSTTTTTTSATEPHESEETNRGIMAKSAERLPGTSTRLRTRDDGCCSVNFLKYVLHIYNVVLFVSKLMYNTRSKFSLPSFNPFYRPRNLALESHRIDSIPNTLIQSCIR